jgi:transcriptional regulator with XRE-family HTH domain
MISIIVEKGRNNIKRYPKIELEDGSERDVHLLELGRRISKLRKERILSIRNLADLIGLDSSKLSKIERGKINITELTLHSICTGLGLTVAEFWNYDVSDQAQLLEKRQST